MAIVFAAITVNAQKIKEAEVPTIVIATFAKQYPNTKANGWEKEKGSYEAEFEFNKTEMSVLIDVKAGILETETKIKVIELPKTIIDYCKQNFKEEIKEASRIVDSKGTITYEVEINKMDELFDNSGKFIKESKD